MAYTRSMRCWGAYGNLENTLRAHARYLDDDDLEAFTKLHNDLLEILAEEIVRRKEVHDT